MTIRTVALATAAVAAFSTQALGNPLTNPASDEFVVRVVSSAAHQISGGDARLHIDVPRTVPLHQVEVWVNGVDRRSAFSLMPGTRRLTGVIDGLGNGDNALLVKANGSGKGRPAAVPMNLRNHPITGPIFSGPQQYPFVCTTMTQGLGQPIPDDPVTGTKVLGPGNVLLGYSRNCSAPTQVLYQYRSTANSWKAYTLGMDRPADMAQTTTTEGKTVDYIVRLERGTINRFIYTIAMLAPFDTDPASLNRDAWNGKVIYRFEGGVAIGHTQGSISSGASLYDIGLRQGYAVLFSTGNRTNVHYNLVLGGETALMVKERFIELYDVPTYTIAIGGSGGAIQQYVYAQNHPGLLDGGIPQYSYPDMVTQTVHVGDCELLEFYMDALDGTNPRWSTWTNRSLLEGMAASNTLPNAYRGGLPGLTECINGWRGLSPLALNPRYGAVANQALFEPQSAIAAIEWTHFDDIVNIVGRGSDGFARRYWDNVGVQYGLEAVATGAITPAEFLKANGAIGGWKAPGAMVQEGSPFVPGTFDPWSQRNQVYSINPAVPAVRTPGDIEAMRAVYLSGLVFRGNIDIPIIDWRHHLEDELDMHNSHQSFAVRKRMLNHDGDASNLSIWFTDVVVSNQRFEQTPEALAAMDQWLMNIRANPALGVAANKPDVAQDRCFNETGAEVARGPGVWDGIIDARPKGACTNYFRIYSTSRRVAGGPYEQSLFKCQLMPVSTAISRGLYGVWTPSAAEQATLNAIFPQGVCDYSLPDAGLPPGW